MTVESYGDSDKHQAFAEQVTRHVFEAATELKGSINTRGFDYTWLDVEDAAETARERRDKWLHLMGHAPSARKRVLEQWAHGFLRDYCIDILGARAFAGGRKERIRLIEELVNWTQAEVRKRKSNGSFKRVESDDAVQEVCLKVWSRFSQYRGEKAFSAWVRMIIRNALVDAIRHADIVSLPRPVGGHGSDTSAYIIPWYDEQGHLNEGIHQMLLDRENPNIESSASAKEMDMNEFKAFIDAFLDGYSNQTHAQVFRLFYWDNFSLKQIEAKVGVGVGGIGAILHRMRGRIRLQAEAKGWAV